MKHTPATQMTLAVAEAIVQRRDVSWIALSTGEYIKNLSTGERI